MNEVLLHCLIKKSNRVLAAVILVPMGGQKQKKHHGSALAVVINIMLVHEKNKIISHDWVNELFCFASKDLAGTATKFQKISITVM